MPAALDVDREQVRMLVLNVGVREAARKMGIAEGTVQDWSATGKWLKDTKATPAKLPLPASMVRPTSPTKPADALAATLAEKHGETKMGLAKWAAKGATALSKLKGEEALAAHQPAVAVASVMGKVWPEQVQPNQMVINIALLGRSLPEMPVCGTVVELASSQGSQD